MIAVYEELTKRSLELAAKRDRLKANMPAGVDTVVFQALQSRINLINQSISRIESATRALKLAESTYESAVTWGLLFHAIDQKCPEFVVTGHKGTVVHQKDFHFSVQRCPFRDRKNFHFYHWRQGPDASHWYRCFTPFCGAPGDTTRQYKCQ